jgi:hypothetical protein
MLETTLIFAAVAVGVVLIALGLAHRLGRRRTAAVSPPLLTHGGDRPLDRDQVRPVVRSPKLAGDTAPRLTEDDIAKARLGEQGVPGQPPKKPVMSADELQISRTYDPGHTA